MFENQIIPGYRHQPGFHCASSAIRNVLAFRGIQVSEPTVIGLGRAPGLFYQVLDHRPSRLVHTTRKLLLKISKKEIAIQ